MIVGEVSPEQPLTAKAGTAHSYEVRERAPVFAERGQLSSGIGTGRTAQAHRGEASGLTD